MATLFDEYFTSQPKVGNPYHDRRGKYTDAKTAAKEQAEKRADIAEHNLAYVYSCYQGMAVEYARVLRENEILKLKLNANNESRY